MPRPKFQPSTDELVQKFKQLPSLNEANESENETLITLSASGWTLGHLAQVIAQEYGVSIVLQDSLESKQVVGEFQSTPVSVVVDSLAKRAGAHVRKLNGVYYVGSLDRGDRGILVRRVSRLKREDLQSGIQGVLSEGGSVIAYDDGLVIVSDQNSQLEKVNEMLDSIEDTGLSSWVVQVFVVSFSESATKEFGLDVSPAGNFAARVAILNASHVDVDFDSSNLLSGVLRAANERSDVVLAAQPVLMLSDGTESTFKRQQRIPFFQSETSTSGNGVVSNENRVEFLDVGFDLNCTLRELSGDRALLRLVIDSSDGQEAKAGLPPTTSVDRFESSVPVESGKTYLVGSFESTKSTQGKTLGLRRIIGKTDEKATYQVWISAYSMR